MDWRSERKSSFFPARLGFLGAIGVLSLTACVSGTLTGSSNQQQGNNAQAGAGAGLPGGGQGSGQGAGTGTESPPVGTAGSGAVQAPTALPTESACSSPGSPGPRVLRRLTASEFAASIADLFGDKTAPVAQVFNDTRVLGFTVDSNALRVQDLNADQLMTNAEGVANWVVSTPAQMSRITQLSGCS
ncbi:MAG TPA: DUF1587 domain-containing protein, partial [Polyangiaceae bacterium]|nr:DUF1587 domain-containing protein [Polyangiaceae bacterium]